MFSRKVASSVVIIGGLYLTGCNVGPLFRDRQPPKGPTVAEAELQGGPGADAEWGGSNAGEVDLVEAVVEHRAGYHQALRALRDYYHRQGYVTKEDWAGFELKGLRSVKAFRYLLDAEVAAEDLSAKEQTPEADAVYRRGQELMRRGGHRIPGVYNQDLMIQAADVFKELIEQHPGSDKIDDAAFLLGEIHRLYFSGQEAIAVKWYERAWMWDPRTPYPARFRAAQVYDHRLHDRVRALELYHSVVQNGAGDAKYVRAATRRIHELSAETSRADAHQP